MDVTLLPAQRNCLPHPQPPFFGIKVKFFYLGKEEMSQITHLKNGQMQKT